MNYRKCENGCEGEIEIVYPCFRHEVITYPNELMKTANYTKPFMCYRHRDNGENIGGSINIGGVIYKGDHLPGFKNKYIFGDWTQPCMGGKYLGVGNLYHVCPNKDYLQKLQKVKLVDIGDTYAQPGYFLVLGTNSSKTRIFLGACTRCGIYPKHNGRVYELVATKCGYSTSGYYTHYDTTPCSKYYSSDSGEDKVRVTCIDLSSNKSRSHW